MPPWCPRCSALALPPPPSLLYCCSLSTLTNTFFYLHVYLYTTSDLQTTPPILASPPNIVLHAVFRTQQTPAFNCSPLANHQLYNSNIYKKKTLMFQSPPPAHGGTARVLALDSFDDAFADADDTSPAVGRVLDLGDGDEWDDNAYVFSLPVSSTCSSL